MPLFAPYLGLLAIAQHPWPVVASSVAALEREVGGPAVATSLPGREADARVAAIAFRIATVGIPRCPSPAPATGMVLEHLSQFELADRARLTASQALNRGPEVVAVVRGGPADTAGIRPGDVILAVDDAALPRDDQVTERFDAARARTQSDLLTALVAGMSDHPHPITLLRRGNEIVVSLTSRPACPSHVHLARSAQLNAYADGSHVFLTTGLLARLGGDDELAFVIAHEMAHNILGHAALMHRGAPVRSAERDADRLGGELMLDAEYDPVVGAEALRRLGGLDLGIHLFASHDTADERVAAMRRLAAARAAR